MHSKAFRRLKHKTQVFFAPTGDHYRTRLTHTLEVSQIARSIAKVLRLHEELTEAIALGHDLGHTPFGHAGQDELNSCMRELAPAHETHWFDIYGRVAITGEPARFENEARARVFEHIRAHPGVNVSAPDATLAESNRRVQQAARNRR